MSRLLLRFRILPSEANIKAEELREELLKKLPEGITLRDWRGEPVAFGLEALILDVEAEEREGIADSIEEVLGSSKLVGSLELKGVSRLSTRL